MSGLNASGDQPDGRYRSGVCIGSVVDIVQKQHQQSGKQTRGIVACILTNSSFHPHGIKVRLKDGKVGRVSGIIAKEEQ
ncbi:MAG: YwbE family protein [Methanoregulaceae archaeon]|nr:YwbE family protein [Methanoregulaceae archaeon]